jgi:glycosyltransferase involved in cell wall biosynthesis
MSAPVPPSDGIAVLAPVHPLLSGAAQFNTAMVAALEELVPVTAISWRRLYPPLLHRRETHDRVSRPERVPAAAPVLDWADPRSWRAALKLVAASGARAMVLPWVHPVMAPPYRYLMRHAPPGVARVVICHNVEPHEPVPAGRILTRLGLSAADLFVVHAGHQPAELDRLGLTSQPVLGAFHPRFSAEHLSATPAPELVAAERSRSGDADLTLLAFGAIRPYKGVDLALEAVARLRDRLHVRLTVAGVFWDGGEELRRQVARLGIEDRVALRDGFVPNPEAAVLFAAADASLLPYRSATQSGVVQLSFAYGVPVVATAVGGLPEAIDDGVDGILCPPGDVDALCAAIERLAADAPRLREGVRRAAEETSFRRYGELLLDAVAQLAPSRLPPQTDGREGFSRPRSAHLGEAA